VRVGVCPGRWAPAGESRLHREEGARARLLDACGAARVFGQRRERLRLAGTPPGCDRLRELERASRVTPASSPFARAVAIASTNFSSTHAAPYVLAAGEISAIASSNHVPTLPVPPLRARSITASRRASMPSSCAPLPMRSVAIPWNTAAARRWSPKRASARAAASRASRSTPVTSVFDAVRTSGLLPARTATVSRIAAVFASGRSVNAALASSSRSRAGAHRLSAIAARASTLPASSVLASRSQRQRSRASVVAVARA
jgi:hypothetical protein